MEVSLPHGPDFFQFGSPELMLAALAETGFADVEASYGHRSCARGCLQLNRVLRQMAFAPLSPII